MKGKYNREEIEELFESKYENLNMSEDYKEKLNELDDKIQKLFAGLTKDQITEVDDLLSVSNGLSYDESKESFVLGFKTAINLIFESLREVK